ncbi:MAG: PQQ-binding-like beta-propeller repeat protein [Chloroflexota bacterium]
MSLPRSLIFNVIGVVVFGILLIVVSFPQGMTCGEFSDLQVDADESRGILESSLDLEFVWGVELYLSGAPVVTQNGHVTISHYSCNTVYSLDLQTGELNWETSITAPWELYTDRSRNRVYVFSMDMGRHIDAIDAETGEKLWRSSVGGRTRLQILSAENGNLYVIEGSGAGTRYQPVDPDTGEFGEPIVEPYFGFDPGLIFDDHRWYVEGQQIVMAPLEEDRAIWRSQYREGTIGCCLYNLVISDDYIGIQVGGDIASLERENGELLWHYTDEESPIVAGSGIANGRVYGLDVDASLIAFDVATGEVIGSTQFAVPDEEARNAFESDNSIGSSEVIAYDDYVIVYFADTDLLAVFRAG